MDSSGTLTTLGAVVGTALGVFNLWRSLRKDRVEFRVYLGFGSRGPDTVELFVTNLSAFEVSVVDAGFYHGNESRYSVRTTEPDVGPSMPVRIKPLDEVRIDFAEGDAPSRRLGLGFVMLPDGTEIRQGDHIWSRWFRRRRSY